MSEQELQREAKHRLAVIRHAQEVTGNVAQTCRYYGISRQTYYSWVRRYDEFGLDGLRDRSKRPKVSPWATPSEVVAKIVYLRSNYHFGPQKIQMYLKRYHDIAISPSGIWRILKRLDMNRLPASQQLASDRRRGVLPPPQRRRHRRCGALQREAPGMGALLQLRSASRRLGRADAV